MSALCVKDRGNSIGQTDGRIRSEVFVPKPESIGPSKFRRPVKPLRLASN